MSLRPFICCVWLFSVAMLVLFFPASSWASGDALRFVLVLLAITGGSYALLLLASLWRWAVGGQARPVPQANFA